MKTEMNVIEYPKSNLVGFIQNVVIRYWSPRIKDISTDGSWNLQSAYPYCPEIHITAESTINIPKKKYSAKKNLLKNFKNAWLNLFLGHLKSLENQI